MSGLGKDEARSQPCLGISSTTLLLSSKGLMSILGEDCTTYLRIIEGKLPVVVDAAEVATVKASEASDVKSNTS